MQKRKTMFYRLTPALQPYAWGGYDFIPALLGKSADGTPHAELWYGDHPQAPAHIEDSGQTLPLDQWLTRHPEALGAERKLPFLLKILDVRLPLSIQLHPDKARARAGYAREIRENTPENKRNYVDDNHKPESMVALSEFWLLHGFAPLDVIRANLQSRPSLAPLADLITQHGLHTAYAHILRAPQQTLAAWLHPLLDTPAPAVRSANPDYWLHHTVRAMAIPRDTLDAGLLSFYLMNIVHLQPGEGIYQPARLPHAYLYGQNVELMAASNNVLRAGLTPKHIDIEELLAVIDTTPVTPDILPQSTHYPAPVDDYTLHTLRLNKGESAPWQNSRAAILLAIDGVITLTAPDISLTLKAGEAAFMCAGTRCTLHADSSTYLAIASY